VEDAKDALCQHGMTDHFAKQRGPKLPMEGEGQSGARVTAPPQGPAKEDRKAGQGGRAEDPRPTNGGDTKWEERGRRRTAARNSSGGELADTFSGLDRQEDRRWPVGKSGMVFPATFWKNLNRPAAALHFRRARTAGPRRRTAGQEALVFAETQPRKMGQTSNGHGGPGHRWPVPRTCSPSGKRPAGAAGGQKGRRTGPHCGRRFRPDAGDTLLFGPATPQKQAAERDA